MFDLNNNNKIVLLIGHILLGIILSKYLFLSTYIGIIVIGVGTYFILNKFDPLGHYPLFFSAYIVGLEVLLRMGESRLLWEFGKYAVVYFIILGIFRKKIRLHIYLPILFYFILLLPAIIMVPTDSLNIWRQYVSFNLSGPACLMFSVIYLFNCTISMDDFKKILLFIILPIISISFFNIFSMPDLSTYHFQPYSNFTTSGGYGPNQVSTLFGLGIVCILTIQVLKTSIFGSKIDLIVLTIFSSLGLITFSRGGIIAAIVSFVLAISYHMFHDQKKIYIISKGLGLLAVALFAWFSISSITDGVISQRYGFSSASYGEKFMLDLSGRTRIYEIDLAIFRDHIITGVGPGQADELRHKYGYGKRISAHTEYSRMLAEHGFFGLFSLFILLLLPILRFTQNSKRNVKFIKIIFGVLGLLTLSHSAMRVAMPSFILGFLFTTYKD